MTTLNSYDGDQELPADVTGVSMDTMKGLLVSETQNINININNLRNKIGADCQARDGAGMMTTKRGCTLL